MVKGVRLLTCSRIKQINDDDRFGNVALTLCLFLGPSTEAQHCDAQVSRRSKHITLAIFALL